MPLLILLFAIALQVFLTAKKLSPFLSLLIVSLLAGLLLGLSPAALLASVEKGVGGTLGGLVLVICLGAILGKILETSGAAGQISATLIRAFGQKGIQWAMATSGFFIGLPLFYNAGFIILLPLIFSIAHRSRLPLLYLAIPVAASLSVTHCFLPPHPSPVALVKAFGADTGKTLLYGLCIAVPAVVVAGPLLGRVLKKVQADAGGLFAPAAPTSDAERPPVATSFFLALLPVFLITASVLASQFLPVPSLLKTTLTFVGDATVALLLTVLLATWLLGVRRGRPVSAVMAWAGDAVAGIASILLIIAAGGVLKQVLLDSGTGAYITAFSSRWQLSPLVFAWLVTAALRVSIGSATVSGLTAAGVVAPLLADGQTSPELMVLAVGAGSVFGSHINDSGFWMFKEFFGLTLKQTFLSWTVMECLISVLGLAGVWLLQRVV